MIVLFRYVSFGEIFLVKSVEGFTDEGYDDDEAMRYATLCFFAGVAITALLNGVVHFVCKVDESPINGAAMQGKCDDGQTQPDEGTSSEDIENGRKANQVAYG